MNLTIKRNKVPATIGTIGFPAQTVSMSEKETDAWKIASMDFMDYESSNQFSEKYEILTNYKMLSGDINLTDYKYVTDPLSIGNNKDTKYGSTINVVHYPICNRPIQTILGEYINRPLNFYVVNESDSARNEYLRVKTELIQNWAQSKIQQRLQQEVSSQKVDPKSQQGQQMMQQLTPEGIQDYMDKDYIDVAEQTSQRILRNVWRSENLDDTFMEGFKDAVVSAREFYHIYVVNKRCKISKISPLEVFYHRAPSINWVSDSQYAGFRRHLTPSSIIDLYFDKLSVKDLEQIESFTNPNKAMASNGTTRTGINSISYDTFTYKNQFGELRMQDHNELGALIDDYNRTGGRMNAFSTYGLIKLVQAYWKSPRKIAFLTYYDEMDQPQKTIVDENYKANKQMGESLSWQYINQIYEGAKIGDNIYLDVEPYTDSILDIDRLDYCPLPIEGCTYNDTNSKPYSLMDLMRPWNELYNIVAYELKKDMNSSLGKVLFMSVDHVPDIPGFTWEKWYYWAKELKIAWVKQPPRGANTFNQFSAADMNFAQQIIAKMDVMERIKQECDAIAGFSQSRVAGSSNQGTLGEAKQSYVASVNQTEYYFFKHTKLVERVLNQVVNITKKLEHTYKVMRAAFNDLEEAYLFNDGASILDASLSLYITNSAQDQASRQKLDQLVSLAVSNGADIVDAGELVMSQTLTETKNIYASLRRKKQQMTQAEQQHEKELQDMKNQQAADALAWDKEKTYATLQNKLDSDYIRTFGLQQDNMKDADGNGTPDILEYEKLNADKAFKNRDLNLKERKQAMDEQTTINNYNLEQQRLQAERYKVDKELQIARENKPARPPSGKK